MDRFRSFLLIARDYRRYQLSRPSLVKMGRKPPEFIQGI